MGKRAALDWEQFRREWLSSDLPISEFFKHKGIAKAKSLQQRAWRDGWMDQKKAIEREIDKRVQAKIVKDGVKDWEEEIALLKGFRDQVAFVLKKHMDKDGNVTSPIDPMELKALAEVMAKNVVAKKHIKGEPVGGGDVNLTQNNLHVHLMDRLEKSAQEIENARAIPTRLDPPPPLQGDRG